LYIIDRIVEIDLPALNYQIISLTMETEYLVLTGFS